MRHNLQSSPFLFIPSKARRNKMNMPLLLIKLKIEIHPIPFVSIEETRQRHVGNYRSVSNNQKLFSTQRKREKNVICIISVTFLYKERVYDNNVSSSASLCGTSTSLWKFTFLKGAFVNASRFLVGELLRLFSFSR